MADLVIHDIDPALEARLRDLAARKGRTMEDEAAALLGQVLSGAAEEQPAEGREGGKDWVDGVVELFRGIGLKPGEELPRLDWAHLKPPDFSKW